MSLKSHIIKTAAGLGLAALPFAQASAGDVTVGGGMRTSFSAMNFDTVVGEDEVESDSTSDFALNSARLYISGKATDNIGFMFNVGDGVVKDSGKARVYLKRSCDLGFASACRWLAEQPR